MKLIDSSYLTLDEFNINNYTPGFLDFVHQVEEVRGRQRFRVQTLRVADVLADRRDALRREPCVVAHEILDESLKIGKRVVHRGCGEQHHLLGVLAHRITRSRIKAMKIASTS